MTAVRLPISIGILALAVSAAPQVTLAAALVDNAAGLMVSPWRVIGSLLLCLTLGAVAIALLRRRYGGGRGTLLRAPTERRIRVIEQHGLGPQRSLSLIEIDRRTYAALIAPGAAALIALERPDAAPEADAA